MGPLQLSAFGEGGSSANAAANIDGGDVPGGEYWEYVFHAYYIRQIPNRPPVLSRRVLERTPEIGLRRALGARRRHIAEQFLAGREFTVAVLGNERLQTFPVWETWFDKLPAGNESIATARVKWDERYQQRVGLRNERARDLPPALEQQIDRIDRRDLPANWDKDLPTFPADAKGLQTFRAEYGAKSRAGLLLHDGEDTEWRNGV